MNYSFTTSCWSAWASVQDGKASDRDPEARPETLGHLGTGRSLLPRSFPQVGETRVWMQRQSTEAGRWVLATWDGGPQKVPKDVLLS